MDMVKVELGGSMAEQVKKMQQQDAFEESSGPIIYLTDNRMPATVEFKSALIYIVYAALVLGLVLILPGIRRTKFRSSFCLLTLLTVGASILLAMDGSHWLQGRVSIRHLEYSARRPGETISGQLEVNIGLNSVNVSLSGLLHDHDNDEHSFSSNNKNEAAPAVMYNERFSWTDPEGMQREHRAALSQGLPYPILTVSEYLSHDADGFNWSRRLREAGHFTSMFLRAALLCWLLTAISVCLLPSLLGGLMLATGSLMMASVGVYALLIPSMDSLAIRMMGGQMVEFEWGFNYIVTHVVGLLTVLAGLIMFLLQEHSDPSQQFTIMESERNALDKKALCAASKQFGLKATIDSKPAGNDANNNRRLIDLVIGGGGGSSSQPSMHPAAAPPACASQSVIIPIGDIEENFRPTTN